jgi:hypothetical protein
MRMVLCALVFPALMGARISSAKGLTLTLVRYWSPNDTGSFFANDLPPDRAVRQTDIVVVAEKPRPASGEKYFFFRLARSYDDCMWSSMATEFPNYPASG